MRKLLIFIVSGMMSSGAIASNDIKPFTFWYWMYGAVSKPGIHADLVGMKNVGLGGCYLMPIRSSKDKAEYQGTSDQLTPEFWSNIDYAFQQADSLGLEMGIHISDGFALAGGPWITPEESMQKVVWSDTIVSAASLKKGITIARPEAYQGYYEDIACYAIPLKSTYKFSKMNPVVSGTIVRNEKGVFRANEPGYILYDLGSIHTIRSMQIVPSGNNIQSQRLKVMASNDGKNYWMVKQLKPARQGWQSYGPSFTYSIPATSARYFKFEWTAEGSEPGSEDLDPAKWKPTLKIKDILLCEEAKINQWEGKSSASWRIADASTADDVSPNDCIMPADMMTMTQDAQGLWHIKQNAKLNMKQGMVRILRFGHTSTGQMNATAGGGKGLEVDKFNQDAVDKQFDNWYKKFLERPYGQVVKYLHVDSWECGTQNWGYNFAREFELRRGYNLIPYLPLYAGIPMESALKSEQVLKDIRLTINELVSDVFFERLEERGHNYWKRVSHESIAPTFIADGLEHFKYADLPMGEFWLNSPTHDKPNDMLDAVSGAHIYGKNIVQAEGFTEVRGVWDETPAMIKPLLDREFALGMNKLFFHVDAHNPWMDRKPGMTLDGIGLFFQRDNTWYHEAKGLVDYVTRCQTALQKGHPVVDIAVFTGEEMPSRSFTPDRLVNILPGIFGKERVASEQKRLANEGEPMEESPVGVNHSAGILDLKDWVDCMHGYKYDSMNKDALMNEATKIENGRIVMPGGVSYRILVLPCKTKMDPNFKGYSQEVNERIEQCRKAGVIVIEQPYNNPDFSQYQLPRDIEVPADIAWTHRSTETEDIYFIANQQNEDRDIVVAFPRQQKKLSLHLAPYESRLINLQTASDDVKNDDMGHELSGKWKIAFERTQQEVTTEKLFDWSTSDNEKIKYYSGSARYTTTFKYKGKKSGQVKLNLGVVKDIAHVYVNGKDCGIAWTAPYEVDITQALQKGKNNLEIVVTNTWRNALLGADLGKAPYEGIWTNAKYRMKGQQLLKAGLTGPVIIK